MCCDWARCTSDMTGRALPRGQDGGACRGLPGARDPQRLTVLSAVTSQGGSPARCPSGAPDPTGARLPAPLHSHTRTLGAWALPARQQQQQQQQQGSRASVQVCTSASGLLVMACSLVCVLLRPGAPAQHDPAPRMHLLRGADHAICLPPAQHDPAPCMHVSRGADHAIC